MLEKHMVHINDALSNSYFKFFEDFFFISNTYIVDNKYKFKEVISIFMKEFFYVESIF